MSYSILTPYIIPENIKKTKKVNIGDGFILEATKKLLHSYQCKYEFSSRKALGIEDINKINKTKALIIAGANQLNDKYFIVPGFSINDLDKIKVPIIPFGVGVSGVASKNIKMSEHTKQVLKKIHEKIEYSSWRCPHTVFYLKQNLPELNSKFLMTGCAVIYGEMLLNGKLFSENFNKIAITITERGDWWEREKKTIDFVINKFPNSEKYLVLHQDFTNGNLIKKLNDFIFRKNKPRTIRNYAKRFNIKVYKPKTAQECMEFYNDCDFHIGSRLHAHLLFLGMAKKSFLTHVDDRCIAFSNFLKFPVVDINNFEKYLNYDFEIYRSQALLYYKEMERFINSLKKIL